MSELPFDLPAATTALLEQFGFRPEAFVPLKNALQSGEFPKSRNQIDAAVEVPPSGSVTPWPGDDPELIKRGQQALDDGEAAVLILNGGMATRFGSVVKGCVEVMEGKSFLALQIEAITQVAPKTPIFLMNSFATHDATQAHLKEHGLDNGNVHCLRQGIALRLTPEGELFAGGDAKAAYAPGHGDVFDVLRHSPEVDKFRAQGGKTVFICNVDNLAASLNPVVLGSHLQSGKPATFEVTARAEGDKGGAPVMVDGKMMILEGFRFPPSFDIAQVPVFNTNTLTLNLDTLDQDYPLTWFRADKVVDGEPVVQFERLMGEISSFVATNYLEVPREGVDGRFLPVKSREDLEFARSLVQQRRAG